MYICSLTSAIGRERLCVNVNLSNSSLIEFDNSKHLDRGSLTSGEALVVEACEHPVLSSELREYCSGFSRTHHIIHIHTYTSAYRHKHTVCVHAHTQYAYTNMHIHAHTHRRTYMYILCISM